MLIGITLLVGSFRADAGHLAGHHHPGRRLRVHRILGPGGQRGLPRRTAAGRTGRPAGGPGRGNPAPPAGQDQPTAGTWSGSTGSRIAGMPEAELAARLPLMAGRPGPGGPACWTDGRASWSANPWPARPAGRRATPCGWPGPHGPVALPIAGIAYDYTSEGGTAFVRRADLRPALRRRAAQQRRPVPRPGPAGGTVRRRP